MRACTVQKGAAHMAAAPTLTSGGGTGSVGTRTRNRPEARAHSASSRE